MFFELNVLCMPLDKGAKGIWATPGGYCPVRFTEIIS